QVPRAHGVQAREGLVEDQEPRPVGDSGGELHALRHALGELLQLAPGVSYHAYGIQRPLGRSPRIGAWKPLEPREVGDGLQRRLPFIQAAFLWQIADLIEHAADSWLPQYLERA